MKILLSGGHLTPALAFIDYINEQEADHQIIFAGRTYMQKGSGQRAKERAAVTSRGAMFVPFRSGKLTPGLLAKLTNGLQLIRSTISALILVGKYQPDVFISFGGYLAVPLAFACFIWRVPIITHEQTRTAGIANKWISTIANAVAISHPESRKLFPKKKTHLTGNIIRQGIFKEDVNTPPWYETRSQKPILFITGGSQGSEVINTTISQIIRPLVRKWVVVHQCGPASRNRNYAKEMDQVRSQLPSTHQSRYMIREWLTEDELAWMYDKADLVISRAGANTTQEIAMHDLPAIFIPLPFSHNGEQEQNAQAIAASGGALVLSQKQLNPEKLLSTVNEAADHLKKLQRGSRKIEFIEGGAANLYQLVKEVTA